DAGDADRLAGADGLVGEAGAGVARGHVVARDLVVRQGHGGGGVAVVGLVDAGGTHDQGPRRDVGGGVGSSVGAVVAGVGAAQADAGDAHRLTGADGIDGEAGAGVARRHVVARDPVVGQGHGRRGVAVVGLVDAGGAHRHCPRRDVGAGVGGGVGAVVPGVAAGDADAGDADRLAGADVLVGEAGAGVGRRHGVAREVVVRERDGRGRGLVVAAVHAGGAHGERPCRDVGGGAGAGVGAVVPGVSAAHADAGDTHPLAVAHV